MVRVLCAAIVAAVTLVSIGTLEAQEKFPPAKFTNLQIFPKDTSPAVLINAMKNFTRALGVRCQFCHIGEEGLPLEKFDFISDAKAEKQVARMMMRLAGEINGQITKSIPDAPAKGFQVTCWTCHRGAQHPQHAPDGKVP